MFEPIMSNSSYLPSLIIALIVVIIGVIRVIKIFLDEGVIQHIKDDWTYRLPYHLHNNRYRGLSRPSYAILCCIYYPLKDLFLLALAFDVYAIKFIFWDFWKWLFTTNKKEWFKNLLNPGDDEDYDEYDEDPDEDSIEPVCIDSIEELPFCQLFTVGPDMCLLVDHIEMSPDEVAYIRVVDDEGYTPLYKRKVRRDKAGNRFIVFNGTNHYLDDSKTQPIISK